MNGHLTEATIDALAEAPEGAAPADAAAAAHLARCPECRDEVRLARELFLALAAVPRLEAPPTLALHVMAEVSRRQVVSQGRTVLWAALAALAAAAVVVIWLLGGGAAGLVVEALDAARAADLVARVAASVWRTVPVEVFVICTIVLVASSAALGRLVGHGHRSDDAATAAG
jgi:anti-sigma factor RsiW